jgi:hypothetical protein
MGAILSNDRRPLDCRQWMCGWKRDEDGHMLGDELRPDQCGFIIDPRKFRRGISLLEIIVDEERNNVEWEALYRIANRYKERGVLVVADGPDGDDLVFIAPSLEERAYARLSRLFSGGAPGAPGTQRSEDAPIMKSKIIRHRDGRVSKSSDICGRPWLGDGHNLGGECVSVKPPRDHRCRNWQSASQPYRLLIGACV